MKLSRRGFIEAVTLPREVPGAYVFDVLPYLPELLPDAPVREVTFYKGRSIGPTTVILENVMGYLVADALACVPPRALPEWVNADIEADLRNGAAYIERYREQHRMKKTLERLAAVMRQPHDRPDLVVIDGIGYGKDDPLPPPFGSGK